MSLLLKLESDNWQLEIVGPMHDLPPFIKLTRVTTVELEGSAKISVYERDIKDLASLVPGDQIVPLFFENTSYDFYFKTISSDAFLSFPSAASPRHKFGEIAHYSVNFHNDVGWAEVKIHDNTVVTRLRFEVFPLKVDYRTDYELMRDDVSAITRNLAMTVQARTFGLAEPVQATYPTLAEWFSLIRHYFDDLMGVGWAIARNPHSKLRKSIRQVPLERSRHIDERALDRVLRGSIKRVGGRLSGIDIQLPARVPESVKRVTFDTSENRYLKALLLEVRYNLLRIIRSENTGDEDAEISAEQKFFKVACPEARLMLKELQNLLTSSFLKNVAVISSTFHHSLVLDRHPHYARFAKIARLLNGGLSFSGDILRIGVKNIALLYEYWCFLKLIELLRERFRLEQQSVVKIKRLRVTVALKKGVESVVRFQDPRSGKHFYLVYNRLFSDLPTLAQRPDNVVQLASDEGVFYVFDAKYKLAFDRNYRRRYQGVGPTTDDINTMHRYRDAIALPHPLQAGQYSRGVVKEAIVLFPYPDEDEYRDHQFYKSLGSVGIGGLPFLPSTIQLVSEKVEEILISNGYIPFK